MRGRLILTFLVLSVLAPSAALAQTYPDSLYARGDFYAGCGEPWCAGPGNQMFDDGLHGDGAAGDSVWGGAVVTDQPPGDRQWKIATRDWSQNWPLHPIYNMSNAHLLTTAVAETLRFRLDLNARGGWQPLQGAVWCSHGLPEGVGLEILGSAPELGSWTTPVPAAVSQGVWSSAVTIASPGTYEYKFRSVGTWEWAFGMHYNMGPGDNFQFTTDTPDSEVLLQFDANDGRSRVIPRVPVKSTSWGRIKHLYR